MSGHRAAALTAISAWRAQTRSIPHWMERAAAGVLHYQRAWIPAPELAAIDRRRREIEELRARRREARKIIRKLGTMHAAKYIHGIRVEATLDESKRLRFHCGQAGAPSARKAVREYLRTRPRKYGHYTAQWVHTAWRLSFPDQWPPKVCEWPHRPTRKDIADAIRAHRASPAYAALPAVDAPDTLGWRAWYWERGHLVSPYRHTPWETPECIADAWTDDGALRGTAGIHALRLPRNWLRARWEDSDWGKQHEITAFVIVTGVVERFRRYVLGTDGWRAEWVIIRELMAPDVRTMIALMRTYPEVRVHLSPHQPEGGIL